MRGGMVYGSSLNPSNVSSGYGNNNNYSDNGIDGQGITQYTNGASSIDVQLAAGQAGGSRRRKMRGGMVYGSSLSPSYVSSGNGNNTNFLANKLAAGQAGGSRRRRKMRGGKGYGWLKGSGIDGQGISQYTSGASSVDVQLAAGQAGGRRRKRRGSKSKSRRSKRGGTIKNPTYGSSNPLSLALGSS